MSNRLNDGIVLSRRYLWLRLTNQIRRGVRIHATSQLHDFLKQYQGIYVGSSWLVCSCHTNHKSIFKLPFQLMQSRKCQIPFEALLAWFCCEWWNLERLGTTNVHYFECYWYLAKYNYQHANSQLKIRVFLQAIRQSLQMTPSHKIRVS